MINIEEAIAEISEKIAREIIKKYRIDLDLAFHLVSVGLMANRKLRDLIKSSEGIGDIERRREFKEAVKDVKKQIYYTLRKYHRDKEGEEKLIKELDRKIQKKAGTNQIYKIRDELLLKHSSTAERFEHYEEFYEELFKIIPLPETILDIACGFHPLSYPFEKHKTRAYVAIDRDVRSIFAAQTFSKLEFASCLRAILCDIKDIEWSKLLASGEKFDLAFMLKLIPLFARQDKDLLGKLGGAAAKQILITGNEEALAKKRSISRSENIAIRKFIQLSGRKIVSEFRIPREFGYLVE